MADFAEQRAVVRELAAYVRETCGDRVDVSVSELRDHPITVVEVDPRARGALPIDIIGEQFLVVGVGRMARWEFDYTTDDIDRVRDIIDAVINGRGNEWSHGGIELELSNGDTASSFRPDRWLAGIARFPLRRPVAAPRRIQPY